MKYCLGIFVWLIILSCERDDGERSFEIPNLVENLKTFINAKKCFEKSINILVVNLFVKNDTLSVEMADTYPDVKEMKFNYDTTLYGHRVIFTGERIKGFNKRSPTNEFPSDIVAINKSKKWLLTEECTIWLYRYKDDKLIYKDLPCVERK